MSLRSVRLVVIGVLVVAGGCSQDPGSTADAPGSPESIYRQFMLASLEGNEARIRPLIVERPGAEVLWQGAYPPEVAKGLAEQYRSMRIIRVAGTDKRVTLKSVAVPSSLDVVFDGQRWRLDPAPMIAVRRAASPPASGQ
jgi:hypothetical protein